MAFICNAGSSRAGPVDHEVRRRRRAGLPFRTRGEASGTTRETEIIWVAAGRDLGANAKAGCRRSGVLCRADHVLIELHAFALRGVPTFAVAASQSARAINVSFLTRAASAADAPAMAFVIGGVMSSVSIRMEIASP